MFDDSWWSLETDQTPDWTFEPPSLIDPSLWEGYETPYGALSTEQLIYDNQTGETITLAQAFERDPTAMSVLLGQAEPTFNLGVTPLLSGLNLDIGGSLGSTLTTPSTGLTSWWNSLSPTVKVGMGLGGATLAVGLIGVIQKALQGDESARQEVIKVLGSASPAEQQAITGALTSFQTINQQLMGGPMGLLSQLGQRTPLEEETWRKGVTSLTGLLQTLSPQLAEGLPALLTGQGDILTKLRQQMLSGNLLTPEMEMLVEQSYSPMLGNITRQAIESARRQGFAGGTELLFQAPAAAMAGPALADVQGQMAKSKLDLATLWPQLMASTAAAYTNPAAMRLAGGTNLINALLNVGTQGVQNKLGTMQAATGMYGAQGQLGNVARLGSGSTTTTAYTPQTLLDAFAPLASLLGGVGGLLSGISGTTR